MTTLASLLLLFAHACVVVAMVAAFARWDRAKTQEIIELLKDPK